MRLSLAVALLVLLAACQRTLRTETRFLPPTAPEQVACVDRCYATDRDCVGSRKSEPRPLASPAQPPVSDEEAARARREYDECSKRAQAEYESCEATARGNQQRVSCYRPVCLVNGNLPVQPDAPGADGAVNDREACGRIFSACYTRCGGHVETREVCEGNC